MRNLSLVIGAALCGITLAMATVGLVWTPYDPLEVGAGPAYAPPSPAHPCGTDWFGRDVLSRVLAAAPVGLGIAALGVAAGGIVGTAAGIASGFYRGYAGDLLAGAIDLLLSFPPVLLALLLVTLLGPGKASVATAIALFNVPYFGRLARAEFIGLRERAFVEAARAYGAGDIRIMLRHILPNAAGPLVVQATGALGFAFLAEAALSYLGLGTQPPYPSWGRMMREAQGYFAQAPWTVIFPGLALVTAVLGVNLLGDGLQRVIGAKRG